jgi:hypothetical protein
MPNHKVRPGEIISSELMNFILDNSHYTRI